MSRIVNFGDVRKARAKAEEKARAAENRARFGRTKAEKAADKAAAEKLRREVDGAKREE
ncbi:MAG: DUF4169 family protein [Caulobacteraceae bacterium]